MSILKLIIDTYVSFLKKAGNYYFPLNSEYSGFRFINDDLKKGKWGKNESA